MRVASPLAHNNLPLMAVMHRNRTRPRRQLRAQNYYCRGKLCSRSLRHLLVHLDRRTIVRTPAVWWDRKPPDGSLLEDQRHRRFTIAETSELAALLHLFPRPHVNRDGRDLGDADWD